ncbi:MAG TPA: arsenosugar biosynthesis radical SAM (seleno)protein ArsS, partial [bacterium]
MEASSPLLLSKANYDPRYDFGGVLEKNGLKLKPTTIHTLQVNLTKLCNQACHHCHVDASPRRTEQMDKETVNRCLEILEQNSALQNLDLTGGAPELNPHFDYFVVEARKRGKHVMVRHNLTVTLDGNPQTKESKEYLPEFFARHQVEVLSSLPYFQEYFTDKQRGKGVFQKSLESLKRLNQVGYGAEGKELFLNLVYNPVGAFLPGDQEDLEKQYKEELKSKYGLVFNQLYTITNMPIHRFKTQLHQIGGYEAYMDKLLNSFNPLAAEGVMCRTLLSVGHDGKLYDCDFNQMLDMQMGNEEPWTVFNFDLQKLSNRRILFA